MSSNLAISTHDAPTAFVTVGDVTYAYRRLGREGGVPLLALQHFTGTLDEWDPAVIDPLAEGRTVLLFENAGVGRSTGTTPNTIEGMAAHAIAFVDALGLVQVDILGFSLGGFIAQRIAEERPQLVRRLVLSGTAPAGGEGAGMARPELLAIFTNGQMSMADKLEKLFFPATADGQRAAAAFVERLAARSDDRDVPATSVVAMAQLQAMAGWEQASPRAPLPHPTLVTNGDNDIMIPTPNSFALARSLPNATLVVYPASGHGALYQYPATYVSHVREHLDRA